MMQDSILAHLGALVACDSQNPPRKIDADSSMFVHVRRSLGDEFEISMTDHGAGHVTLLAVRGRPRTLFNCHLDTVPAGPGWTVPPLELTVGDGRAWGRGTCDIKGAAAALLAVAEATDGPMALLLTSDEEGAGGCCVAEFLRSADADRFSRVVVCEPTGCRAVLAHRGFLSVLGRFRGLAGHSSDPRALADNANHRAGAWIAAAVAQCRAAVESGHEPCFNLGTIHGGLKSNVIADTCDLHWSARLGPGQDNQDLLDALLPLAGADEWAEWQVPFAGPPLPAAGQDDRAARDFAERHGLEIGPPVGFWTEASLFSAAGLPALVLGPGDIAQAHAVDEWVAVEQLDRAASIYRGLVTGDD